MEVKKIDIYSLKIAEYNPRKDLKPSDKEYKRLKKSIQEFGFVDPIIINKDFTVIGGHQRLRIIKDLGFEQVDCVVLDISKEKEKALNIALNKISGKWEEEKLKDLIEDLGISDFESIGFDEKEINRLINKFMPDDEQAPEFNFTEELLEEHNYIVFYFDNALDWQVAKDKFNIVTKDGLQSKKGYIRKGVGRVLKGKELLDRIK